MATHLEMALRSFSSQLAPLLELPLGAQCVSGLSDCHRVWLVGTGTSQHAAELGAMLWREAEMDARAVGSAEFVRADALRPDDGVVIVSHTGETALARAARAAALEAGVVMTAITGKGVGWPEATETIERERSETYSVSFQASLVILARLAILLGVQSLSTATLRGVVHDAHEAANGDGVPNREPPARALVFVGAGPTAVTAREGALKVREAAGILAEGYEAEYLLHGSAVPLDQRDSIVLIDPGSDPTGLVEAIGQAARSEGLAVSVFTPPTPRHPVIDQIVLTAGLQRFALRLAEDRGTDPDHVIRGAWAEERLWEVGAP